MQMSSRSNGSAQTMEGEFDDGGERGGGGELVALLPLGKCD